MQLTQVQCKVACGSLLAQNLYSHVVVLYLHTRRSRSDMLVGKYIGAQLQVTTSNAIRKFGPKMVLNLKTMSLRKVPDRPSQKEVTKKMVNIVD